VYGRTVYVVIKGEIAEWLNVREPEGSSNKEAENREVSVFLKEKFGNFYYKG
jgi:hypothetical protein